MDFHGLVSLGEGEGLDFSMRLFCFQGVFNKKVINFVWSRGLSGAVVIEE